MIFLYFGVILAAILALILITAFICFRRVFYSPSRKPLADDEYDVPTGEVYDVFRDEMIGWIRANRDMPHLEMSTVSFDGLTLRGKFYKFADGAPIEILFHGYRGNSERDLSGAVERCFSLGRSALIVDQRAAGASDGHVISFGINESKDCISWIECVLDTFGRDVTLVLGGVSMGAATVMTASGKPLPPNVKYIVADCGYTSPKEIISKVVREMKLPPKLLYPFIRLGARIFGHFDLEETSPIDAVKKSAVPIIFFHGDADGFVPAQMSKRLFEACSSPKMLSVIPGAEHGLAYPVDKEGYINAIKEFERKISF